MNADKAHCLDPQICVIAVKTSPGHCRQHKSIETLTSQLISFAQFSETLAFWVEMGSSGNVYFVRPKKLIGYCVDDKRSPLPDVCAKNESTVVIYQPTGLETLSSLETFKKPR